MLSVARTGVSNKFREHCSRTASQVSRTGKSRNPNHTPVGIATNGKQTPKVNLKDWRQKLSGCTVCCLHFYTLWCSLELQHTDLPLNAIHYLALPLDTPSVSTLERIANNFLFSQASLSLPLCHSLAKSWQILHFLLLVFTAIKNLYCPCLNFSHFVTCFLKQKTTTAYYWSTVAYEGDCNGTMNHNA